ncbi:related to heterokaryon incompatibility protein (het-6OR allele) [Fusarium mangiferae]|uniref:Related to heterokaryon incompatibility protein (Het-6OR allele) n=1 Tax=Fusarium mangiferae TaxID=192010 RepID=A0A1L7UFN9_FUSMA|nr:uncharacterized protein FMAN_03748 [Fusarium mangiferae]CVL06331.1 related to heterokaryon incompatibility protein (het-6OR allele) [Fusarium mangiferae]
MRPLYIKRYFGMPALTTQHHFLTNLRESTRNQQVYHIVSANRVRNSNRLFSMKSSGYFIIPINEQVSKAIYRDLNNSRQEIRLLRVHPSIDPGASLSCTLLHAELSPNAASTRPSYEALSYVWGHPDLSEPIFLNSHPFFITPSLKYALTSLRQRHKARVLWVDAICINQLNDKERGEQVALMRHVYSSCERDIAWLDPMVTVRLQDKTSYTSQSIEKEEKRVKEGMEFIKTLNRNGQRLKATQDLYRNTVNPTFTKVQKALVALFGSPTLWSRLWSCLTDFFKDEPYIGAFHTDYPTHSRSYYRSFSKVFLPAKRIEDQRRILSQRGNITSDFLDVLTRFRAMESTDPRDKIYGLLGLVAPDPGIEVNYTQPLVDVYKRTTLSLINHSGNLDIICQNPFELWGGPRALEDSSVGNLPSWAAEFDAKPETCVPVLFAQRNIFAAGSKHYTAPCRVLGQGENMLALRGVKLGNVGPILQRRVIISPGLGKQKLTGNHLKKGGWNRFIRSEEREAGFLMEMYLGKEAVRNPDSRLYEPKVGGSRSEEVLSEAKFHCSSVRPQRPRDSMCETAFCAFLRTLFRDCTHPPRIRRLRDSEIASLQVHNRDYTSQRFIRGLKNYKIRDNWRISRYAFSHDPEAEDKMQLAYVGYAPYNRDLMFTITDNGVFLLVRPHVQQGDIVVVLDGAKVPMILRKAELNRQGGDDIEVYRIVCSAYAHGFMDGEAGEMVDEGRLEKQDIFIV